MVLMMMPLAAGITSSDGPACSWLEPLEASFVKRTAVHVSVCLCFAARWFYVDRDATAGFWLQREETSSVINPVSAALNSLENILHLKAAERLSCRSQKCSRMFIRVEQLFNPETFWLSVKFWRRRQVSSAYWSIFIISQKMLWKKKGCDLQQEKEEKEIIESEWGRMEFSRQTEPRAEEGKEIKKERAKSAWVTKRQNQPK